MRDVLRHSGFRQLLATRVAAQWGDGIFQAGLGSAVLFNPEHQAEPSTVAASFAVLLLPYSLIGPFAGALLDRWDRRRVLVACSALRILLILITALIVGIGVAGVPMYVAALVVLGVGRFMLAGLSAALPHVVDQNRLVTGNSVAATLGAASTVLGGGCAIGLRAIFGGNDAGSGWVTACAVAGSVISAIVAASFAPGALGPDQQGARRRTFSSLARGLADGFHAARQVPSVAGGFVALVAHRAAFGLSVLLTVLLMRYSFHHMGVFRAGVGGLGEFAAASGAGILVAAVLTPRLVARFGRRATIALGLSVAAGSLLLFGLPLRLPTMLLTGFLVNGSGQIVKLCVDFAAQHDISDNVRGRVFALYDTLFNVSTVVSIAIGAQLIPRHGHSPGLVAAAAAIYLLGLFGYLLIDRPRAGAIDPASN